MRSARSTPTDRPTRGGWCCLAGPGRPAARGRGRWRARAWPPSGVPPVATRGVARRRSPAAHRPGSTTTADPTCHRPHRRRATAPPPPARGRLRRSMRRGGRIVQPAPAASVRHRVAKSPAPFPDLPDRVSADASRVSAARSQRDASRPSRWRKSSSLSANASSMSVVRFERTRREAHRGHRRSRPARRRSGAQSTPNWWVSSAQNRAEEHAPPPRRPNTHLKRRHRRRESAGQTGDDDERAAGPRGVGSRRPSRAGQDQRHACAGERRARLHRCGDDGGGDRQRVPVGVGGRSPRRGCLRRLARRDEVLPLGSGR